MKKILLKIYSLIFAFFLFFEKIEGYKMNLFLNLSKLKNSGNAVISEYKSYLKGDIFPLISDPDDYIVIEDIYHSATTPKIYGIFKIGKNVWNISMKFCQSDWICRNYAFEGFIDEILNEVFQCENQVSGYKSRFYYLNEVGSVFFDTPTEMRVEIDKEIDAFWLISHKDFILGNNNYNYEKFLAKCHSVPYRFYWLISASFLILLIVLIYILLLFIKRIRVPKIFIRRAPNRVEIIHTAHSHETTINKI